MKGPIIEHINQHNNIWSTWRQNKSALHDNIMQSPRLDNIVREYTIEIASYEDYWVQRGHFSFL